jgi:LmbE family N-acetylglucosaminyl deacetylase
MELLRLLVIGAHPDDAEYKAGGLAALYRSLGHDVRFVSVTNGAAGHHLTSGPDLTRRRRAEAQAAAATIGLVSEVWEHEDGCLEASLARRQQVIGLIRSYRPDLVLTHRPNDYHPDHRATSLLVQDAAYLLTVPAVCPDVAALPRDPVIAYMSDEFTRPYPFDPSVIVDVGPVWHAKIALLHEHKSQFYEWLPFNGGYASDVPLTDEARRDWLSGRVAANAERLAERFRGLVLEQSGAERGPGARLVEAFEACEYGAPLDEAARSRLFPFGKAPRDDGLNGG